jgi:hypothetical protein
MSRHWTTHAGAGHMTLLCNRHGLLRARRHLWVPTGAGVPLTLVLRLLLLAMEWWCEGRSLLAVLLLHMRCKALMRTRGLHHVRTRTRRAGIPVRTGALLGHMWHLRLSVWRHRRVALVLLRHESVRGWGLRHHRRTSSHLRHVRPAETGTRSEVGTHLVHLKVC